MSLACVPLFAVHVLIFAYLAESRKFWCAYTGFPIPIFVSIVQLWILQSVFHFFPWQGYVCVFQVSTPGSLFSCLVCLLISVYANLFIYRLGLGYMCVCVARFSMFSRAVGTAIDVIFGLYSACRYCWYWWESDEKNIWLTCMIYGFYLGLKNCWSPR